MSFTQLLGITIDLKPSIIVAPDFIGRPKESRYVATEFMQFFRLHQDPNIQVMEAVHGDGDPWDYINLYKSSKANWIGVPKKLPNRVELFHNLKRSGQIVDKPHHALGLNSIDELEELAALRVFTSVDSQKPNSAPNLYRELRVIDALCQKYA